MRLLVLFIVFTLTLFGQNNIQLTEKEKKFIKNNPIIKVSAEPHYQPFDFIKEGKPSGFSIDILELLLKDTGLKIEYIVKPWKDLVIDFENGEIDLVHSLYKSKERAEKYNFTKSYLINSDIFVIRKNDNKINGIKDLFGKKVAVGKEWYYEKHLTKFPQIQLVKVDNTKEIFNAINNGTADATIISSSTANYMINKYNYSNLEVSNILNKRPNNEVPAHYFATLKSYPEELVSILNKSLDKLSIKQKHLLQEKWFGNSTSNKELYSLTKEEINYLKQNKSYTVCPRVNHFPLSAIIDNEIVGIGGDIFKNIAKNINLKYNLLQSKTQKEFYENITSNRCDIVVTIKHNQKKFKNLETIDPIFNTYWATIGSIKSNFIDNYTNLSKDIFYVKENFHKTLVLKEYPELNIKVIDNIDKIFSKLKENKNRNFLTIGVIADYYVNKYGIDKFKINGNLTKMEIKGSFGVNKQYPLLISSLNKGLHKIPENELKNIIHRYEIKEYKIIKSYEYLWYVLFLLLITITLLQVWYIKKIKEKQKEKDELQESLNEARKLAKTASFLNDFSKKYYQKVDDSIYDIFEIKKEQFPQINREILFKYIHPEDKETFKNKLLESKSEKKKEYDWEYRIITPNGMVKYLHTTWKVIYDKNNKPIKNLAIIQDITDRVMNSKKIEKLLKKVEKEKERFELATKASESGIIDWNIEKDTVFFSEQWKKIIGYQDHELENKFENWEQLIHPKDRKETNQILEEYLSKHIDIFDVNFRMKHKQGHWIWINAKAKATFNENNKPIRMIGFHTDITRKVKEEEEKQKQLLLIQKQSRMALQGEMLNMIAHQWRQPLNQLSILTQIFIRKIKSSTEEIEELDYFKNKSLDIINHLSQTISDFTNFYKPDKNKSILYLKDLYTPLLILNEEKIIKSNIDFNINYNQLETLKLYTFKNELSQVLLTLLNNSIEASEDNTSRTYIEFNNILENNKLIIIIEDNAGGIPKNIIENIFNPYFSTKEEKNGTGLGLYMAKIIVENSIGGQIEVFSKEKITKFTLELPILSKE